MSKTPMMVAPRRQNHPIIGAIMLTIPTKEWTISGPTVGLMSQKYQFLITRNQLLPQRLGSPPLEKKLIFLHHHGLQGRT